MAPAVMRPAPAVATDTAVELLLTQLLEEVRALRADMRERRPAPSLSRSDRAVLARLLPAIAGDRGSEPFDFTSRDLRAKPGLRVVLRGLSVKQIGRLLSRAEGVPIDGYIVERCGIEINVALWRVLASVSNRLETGTAIARSGSIGRGESDA
jgi:hypothetical protein